MQTAAASVSRLLSVLFFREERLWLFASWSSDLQNTHQTPEANQSSAVAVEGEREYMASFPVHKKPSTLTTAKQGCLSDKRNCTFA